MNKAIDNIMFHIKQPFLLTGHVAYGKNIHSGLKLDKKQSVVDGNLKTSMEMKKL